MIELATGLHLNLVYIYTRFRDAAQRITTLCNLTLTNANELTLFVRRRQGNRLWQSVRLFRQGRQLLRKLASQGTRRKAPAKISGLYTGDIETRLAAQPEHF